MREDVYLQVRRLSNEEFYAILTVHGTEVYKASDMLVSFGFRDECSMVKTKVRGLFKKDPSLRQEALILMNWLFNRCLR